MALFLFITGVLSSLFLVKKLFERYFAVQGLPPGPKGLPLLGNIFDMPDPSEKAWLHWQKFKELYGPVSSVTVLGQTIVVLNEYDIAVELLEKNSAVYSDRASLTFANEMVGWGKLLAFSRYGDRHRQYRRDLRQFLGTRNAAASFMPLLEAENSWLLNKTLRDNTSWRDHIKRTAGSITLRLAYGYTVEKEGPDHLINVADEVLTELALSILPGMRAVDFLPILRYLPSWLPGMSFKRTANEWRKHMMEFVDRPYQFAKQSLSSGTAPPCFVSQMFSSLPSPLTAEDESRVKWVAANIYAGASETSVSSMHTFFLAMVLHPHVQREAQKEIDNIVGSDRLPTAEDRPQLPYVEAVLKECLRWRVVAPMGFPHASARDFTYRGFRIPKGAIVMANIWEFSHDANIYADPDIFNPARFLSIDGHKPEMDPRHYIFGFGRRICPGKELADASMWLSVATSLSAFNIKKSRDDTGKEVTPSGEYDNGFVCYPKYFPCSIVPRSEKSEGLIRGLDYDYPYEKSDSKVLERVKWGEEVM